MRPRGTRRAEEFEDDFREPLRRKQGASPLVWVLAGGGLLLLVLIVLCAGIVCKSMRSAGKAMDDMAEEMKKMPPPNFNDPNGLFAMAGPIQNFDEAITDLKSDDVNRRITTARRLAQTPIDDQRRAEVARALEPLLKDREGSARLAGMQALEVWASRENVPALIELLDSDPTGFDGDKCRKSAIDTLVKLKDPRAAAAIARNFKNPFEREWTRRSLIALGPAAETAVIPYLDDPDFGIKVEACHTLKQIGTKQRALPALQKTLEGTKAMYGGYASVADAARAAIAAINARP
jgi:HEAT repeat protein